jgi:D-3-phosphoglycerate dehydrogenase
VSSAPPFRFWFERTPPREYAQLLDGAAVIVGNETADARRLAAIVDAQAIVASARVHYNAELMDRAPGLRVISRTGMGLDNVSVDAATERGIAVCNVPDGPTISTAEHTVALMLAVAKQLAPVARALREGHGDHFNDYQGVELNGLCLGLVGFGQIGTRVAAIALALGMRVMAFDPFIEPSAVEARGVEHAAALEALLAAADVVSLHAPLTDETFHLMSTERLAQMKPGAILINAARGDLIREEALALALEDGRVGAAGLDVYLEEPAVHPRLRAAPHTVLLPHIGSATHAARRQMAALALANVRAVLNGDPPLTPVFR